MLRPVKAAGKEMRKISFLHLTVPILYHDKNIFFYLLRYGLDSNIKSNRILGCILLLRDKIDL